jgi:hypothetical protein
MSWSRRRVTYLSLNPFDRERCIGRSRIVCPVAFVPKHCSRGQHVDPVPEDIGGHDISPSWAVNFGPYIIPEGDVM